ncbi:MAG: PspC domain-containing protein [Desulfotomaculaceae bacterium]|nr:PspC domain-containing protein [Desulfotomaculaceae bacterium]
MNKLYRSRKTRIIAGVAGGLAEYFEIDVTLVRLLWILTVFAGGTGVLAYIIAVIIIPEGKDAFGVPKAEQDKDRVKPEKSPHRETARRNAGLLLIGLGMVLLAYEILPQDLLRYIWPLLLIALGIFILFKDRRGAGQ